MKYNDYIDKMPDGVYSAINKAHARMRVRAYAYNSDVKSNDNCRSDDCAMANKYTLGENMTQNNKVLKQFNDADDTRSIKKALPGGKAVGLGYDGVRGARSCNAMSSCVVKSNSMSYFRTINECGKGHACMQYQRMQ